MKGVLKSCKRNVNHWSSQTVKARARYSDSKDDRETVGCFLDFHEIGESPRKIQNLVIDFFVSMREVQSTSLNALSWREDEEEKNKHQEGDCLIYMRTRYAV